MSIAKLTMPRELPGFDNSVIGFGAGVFFLGYEGHWRRRYGDTPIN